MPVENRGGAMRPLSQIALLLLSIFPLAGALHAADSDPLLPDPPHVQERHDCRADEAVSLDMSVFAAQPDR